MEGVNRIDKSKTIKSIAEAEHVLDKVLTTGRDNNGTRGHGIAATPMRPGYSRSKVIANRILLSNGGSNRLVH
jgi:hypothetical protein